MPPEGCWYAAQKGWLAAQEERLGRMPGASSLALAEKLERASTGQQRREGATCLQQQPEQVNICFVMLEACPARYHLLAECWESILYWVQELARAAVAGQVDPE